MPPGFAETLRQNRADSSDLWRAVKRETVTLAKLGEAKALAKLKAKEAEAEAKKVAATRR